MRAPTASHLRRRLEATSPPAPPQHPSPSSIPAPSSPANHHPPLLPITGRDWRHSLRCITGKAPHRDSTSSSGATTHGGLHTKIRHRWQLIFPLAQTRPADLHTSPPRRPREAPEFPLDLAETPLLPLRKTSGTHRNPAHHPPSSPRTAIDGIIHRITYGRHAHSSEFTTMPGVALASILVPLAGPQPRSSDIVFAPEPSPCHSPLPPLELASLANPPECHHFAREPPELRPMCLASLRSPHPAIRRRFVAPPQQSPTSSPPLASSRYVRRPPRHPHPARQPFHRHILASPALTPARLGSAAPPATLTLTSSVLPITASSILPPMHRSHPRQPLSHM